ncbi:pectinesterase/pectinesterase inhibitor 51 [Spatholobus suberectus]|nr:pectinesterase/pectinesterase inhibitor 51 [Spatholobus suberectus]
MTIFRLISTLGSFLKTILETTLLTIIAFTLALLPLLCITLLLRFLLFSTGIHDACMATRFPPQCHSSLRRHLHHLPVPEQVLQSAITASSENLTIARSQVKSIVDASAGNRTRHTAAKTCLQFLHYSHRRTSLAARALPLGAIKDARAWMSAALAYQHDCWSGLKYVNDTALVAETVSSLESLTILTSNVLSMMVSFDRVGEDTASWKPPKTERDSFWEHSDTKGPGAGPKIPAEFTADVTVCKGKGEGCYETVQEAVNAAPDNGDRRFVIHIKEGVYEERVRVPFKKRNVVFLGDGMGKTVITGSANVRQPGITIYNSATVGVAGDGFVAKDLTIQNTAGSYAHQAVAFRSDSDLSVIENCEFIGNQDTLYAHSLRQFYKSCRILGNVDFIIGNSASIFQDCEILVRPRQARPEKGESNAITAHGRTDPAQSTGFVFQNCIINGTEEYMALYYSKPEVYRNYLGRPWKEYSRTVFIHSFLESLITPQGWMLGSGDFALKTLYYGEFENSGPGSNLTRRVPWSNQVPAKHVFSYSAQSFIQGDYWNHTNYTYMKKKPFFP